MSDHAVPGDLLYGIDVGVGEPLRVAGALSPQAKIRVDLHTAGERLLEATELALHGHLDPSVADTLSIRFQQAANDAQGKIAVIADVDADLAADLAGEQERTLSAQADLLASLGLLADVDAQVVLGRLEAAARVEADAAKKLRIAVDTRLGGPGLQEHAQAALDVAVKAVADAQAEAAAAKPGLTATANADVTAQVNAANRALLSGQALLEAGAYVEAADLLTTASRLADEATLLSDILVDLDLNANLNADSVLNTVRSRGQSQVRVDVEADVEVDEPVNTDVEVEGEVDLNSDSAHQEHKKEQKKEDELLDLDGLLPDTGIEIDVNGHVLDVDEVIDLPL